MNTQKISKHFNTSGPVLQDKHYYIDPFSRIDWFEIRDLIDREKYFVLHAPRQSGKTTMLNAIVDRLNREGKYMAMVFNVEAGEPMQSDFVMGNPSHIFKFAS
jgi:hypothetical protein